MADATVTVTLGDHSFDPVVSALADHDDNPETPQQGAWSVAVPAGAAYIVDAAPLSLTVTAAKPGYAPASDFTDTLTVDLTAPDVSYTAPPTLTVGVAIAEMRPASVDTDIAAANGYALTGVLPPGLALDADSGVIAGTPSAADPNTSTATVTVTDAAGNPGAVSIAFPPVVKGAQTLAGFAYSAATVTFGDAAPTLTAPTGAPGTLSYAAAPASVCTVDPPPVRSPWWGRASAR